MRRTTKVQLCGLIALVVALPLAAATSAGADTATRAAPRRPVLARDVTAVDRTTVWRLTRTIALRFPTFHTEGIAFVGSRIFLSAVDVTTPTVRYARPRGRYDRTPGKGVGHVFVMNSHGALQRDIVLGAGAIYHPGGLDYDGRYVWVPVAQYRPNSNSLIYRIDAQKLTVHLQFRVNDHIGGIIRDRSTGRLVGFNWGSRQLYEWTPGGVRRAVWDNPSHFLDYQDCQYVAGRNMLCGGVATLAAGPSAAGGRSTYELGGMALINLVDRHIVHEVPVQEWSTAGHAATRNPFKMVASGNRLRLWVAPDNGNEGHGTELLSYEARVVP